MGIPNKVTRFLPWLGVVLLQLIMTQVVTFAISMFFPGIGDTQAVPGSFVALLGVTLTAGVFLAGWLAIRLRWIPVQPKYLARLAGALIGAYLPLIVALVFYHPIEPGNPFFFVATWASILGFYVAGRITRT